MLTQHQHLRLLVGLMLVCAAASLLADVLPSLAVPLRYVTNGTALAYAALLAVGGWIPR